LFEATDSSRDDYKLAEDLLDQAKSQDANDAEVWAAVAQLNGLYSTRGWDRSDARREAARAAVQRALRLDPRSFEARFAQTALLEYRGREAEEKERQLRALRAEQPQNKRVLRLLAATVGYQGRIEETIRLTNEAAALPGGDALALYDQSRHLFLAGRISEAETVLQAALAQEAFSSALLMDIWYKVVLHGDLDGAQALVSRISPAGLQEDRGAYFAYFVALLRRDADGALARLHAMPRDWLNDNFYHGPKALLAGDALLMAGRADAAAIEWRAALKLVEERLAGQPNDQLLLSNRVVLLAHLDREKAKQEFAVFTQLVGLDPAQEQACPFWMARALTQTCILLGRHEDAIRQIRAVIKQQAHVMMDYSAATLRLDPMFDPLRNEPEFQRLLAENASGANAAAPAGVSSPAQSEARRLVAQAQALFNALDGTRGDYKLAEELITEAKAKNPMDAEVAAAEAQLHARFVQRGWDVSDARREAARAATQRALGLDPRSFEARFAQVGLLSFTGREGEEKEKQLRALRAEQPRDQRVLRMLATTVGYQGRTDEAARLDNESAAMPGGDPLALYDQSLHFWFSGRSAEAETALEASIAQRPFTSALLMAAWVKVVLRGDLDSAQALLDRVPLAELHEDRGAYFAYLVALLKRDADGAVTRLRAVPRDWFNDNFYRGPKGFLAGNALAMAGRSEAAAVEWRAALGLVEERLVARPNDLSLLYLHGVLLASLGQGEKALHELKVLAEMTGVNPAAELPVSCRVTRVCILLGRDAEAMRQIRVAVTQPQRELADFSAALLRLEPMFDPLRKNPEFQRLVDLAESIERKTRGKTASSP
jgi:predicted Zn-dependent protease